MSSHHLDELDDLFAEDHPAEVAAGLVNDFMVRNWCGVPRGEVYCFD